MSCRLCGAFWSTYPLSLPPAEAPGKVPEQTAPLRRGVLLRELRCQEREEHVMARNKPVGDNARKGAVKKRSQRLILGRMWQRAFVL